MNIERALKIYRMTYGSDHPETALALNNLGRVLAQEGDFAGAKKHAELALKVLREKLGDEHPNTKITESNLKFMYGLKAPRAGGRRKTERRRKRTRN